VVVDASVLASRFLEPDSNHEIAVSWLRLLADSRVDFHAPAIALAEVTAAVRSVSGDEQLARETLASLRQATFIQLAEVSLSTALRAAELAARAGLKGCDAVYVAFAEEEHASLVTLDREQAERAAEFIPVLSPGTIPAARGE